MSSGSSRERWDARRLLRLVPGMILCAAVGAAAWLLQRAESRFLGHALIEALVLAILAGTVIRTLWEPGERWAAGISFTAKEVLEVGVLLLGATVDLPLILRSGPALFAGIAVVVIISLGASYGIGRALRLQHRLAVLVACGNSICGNSAIAAVAPVIGADSDDIASAIAFTAVLGVGVVLLLPSLMRALSLSTYQYGVLAGLSIYAVPQVIAATFPVSTLSGQVGTLVKLVRVLMLGPLVVVLGIGHRRASAHTVERAGILRFVPWFIVGFLVLAAIRSLTLLPPAGAAVAGRLSLTLTIGSMAALGLGVDVRAVRRVGGRVTAAVTASLVLLIAISVALIRLLGVA